MFSSSSKQTSVTKLDALLHFGQLFKACGNKYFAEIAHILGNFCRGNKIFHFLVESFLGNLIDIWQLFIGHTETDTK